MTPEMPTSGRRSAGRALDAISYLITGVFCLWAATRVDDNAFTAAAVGVCCLGYGAYIALTRGAYWVTTLNYAVPVLALLFVFFRR